MSSQYPILNNRPIDQWKVTELKEELRRRRLSVTGLKQELVRKLDEALQKEMQMVEDENSLNPDLDYKDKGSQLEELNPDSDYKDKGSQLEEFNPDSDYKDKGNQLEENSAKEGHQDIVADTIGKPESDGAMIDIDDSNLNISQGTTDQTACLSGADATVCDATAHAVSVEDSPTESQSMTAHNDSSVPDPKSEEKHENLNAPLEDTKLKLSEPDNQVPVVSPDLGSQIKSESIPTDSVSIPTDSVSITEKNIVKDNLNADNFHLELEFVKPEMVQPSSSSVPSLGGDLHPLDEKEGAKDLGSIDDVDAKGSTNLELSKNEDSIDMGSPEKLNLDRNSDDDSVEENVLETKQVEASIRSKELEEPVEVNKASAVDKRSDTLPVMGGSILGKTNIVDEEKNKPTDPLEKRKVEDHAAVGSNEPIKRQRRWSSETVKVSEQQTSNFAVSSTPKDAFQPNLRDTYSKTDSKPSEDTLKERIVPPSQKPATTSLRIDKFVRPFTLKAVQEMLSKTGTVCSFWMDHIKTHCYVTYESTEEATATRNAVYNLRWPPNGGNLLIAEFVDPQDVKMRVEAPPQSPGPMSPNLSTPKAHQFQQSQPGQPPVRQHSLRQQLPPPPPLPQPPPLSNPPTREQLPPPPPLPKKPEPPVVTLDDLFKKTKATPRIYYLPLTDEQVAAKLAAQAKNTRE